MKKYSLIAILALTVFLGTASFVNAGPTYPYYFNNNGSLTGVNFYTANPNTTPLYPQNPQPTPIIPTIPTTYYYPNTPTLTPTYQAPNIPTFTSAPVNPVQYSFIKINNNSFSPSFLYIQKGTIVFWKNKTLTPRKVLDVTSGVFSSPVINAGGTYSYQFNNTGYYKYQDSVSGAVGIIVVQ